MTNEPVQMIYLNGSSSSGKTVLTKPSIIVMGIQCRTSNSPSEGPVDIPILWGKFFSEQVLSKIPNKVSDEVIALYCDYEGDFTMGYSVVIGCQVSSTEQIPEGMVAKTLPASKYALFRAIGEHPQSLIDTWGKIWQTDLQRTYSGDFEVYGEKFSSSSTPEVEVLIAIE